MYYIGLDLSLSSTGVVIRKAGEQGPPMVAERIRPTTRGPVRLGFLRDRLTKILASVPASEVAMVAIEYYAIGKASNGGGRVFDIGEWGGVARVAVLDAGLPAIEVGTKTLKLVFAGTAAKDKTAPKSKAHKAFVLKMCADYGFETKLDDLADAYALSWAAEWFVSGALGGAPEKEVEGVKQILYRPTNPSRQPRQRKLQPVAKR